MSLVAWIGQSDRARSVNASSVRLVNGYAQVVDGKQGKTLTTVYGTPGLKRFSLLPGLGGIRALYTTSGGRVFAVQGAGVYEIFSDGTARALGALRSISGPVSIDDSGLHVVFVDGPDGWAFDLQANTFLGFSDPNWQGADRVLFLSNQFVFNKPGTQEFYLFARGATVFDALDFASAEGSPDRLISMARIHQELWLFGATTTEVWAPSDTTTFPFARIPGAVINTGCVAPASVATMHEQVYWLAQDERGVGVVVRTQGYLPEPISTHAVAMAVQGYAQTSRIDDAIAYTYEQEKHYFYVLTFPTANATWAYDATTGLWAERASMTPATAQLGRHRSNCHTVGFGTHLVGDYADGRIYTLDLETYADDGDPLPLDIEFPPVFDAESLCRVAHAWVQIDLEAGVGLSGAPRPGTEPQLLLQWSNDGGHTWSTERWLPMGQLGEYARRVRHHRLGAARDRRYRIRIVDPVKRAVIGAYVDIERLSA